MKQILQVCAFGAPRSGNFIKSLLALQERMAEMQYETIYAFAETAQGKEWCTELEKTNKVYFLPVANARILPRTYIKMKQIYEENNISIVHSHFELYDIPATLTAPKNVKIFWHLHDAIKENYIKATKSRKLLMKLQYGIFSRKSTLLTVSAKHGEFVKQLGFNSNRVIYVPNGISFSRLDHEYCKVCDNNFLMFGWEIFRKGVDLVLKAEELVKKSNYTISIVGQEECKRYIEKECKSNNIQFLEPVDDINVLYSNAKVFLHLSRAEGLSYALLEAIYFGMYVICSDIPENEFAKEFRGVDFFKSENTTQIADLVNKYIDFPGISYEDIEYNRKIILEKYSLSSWCEKVINIYNM